MSEQERIKAVTLILKQEYPDKCHPEVVAEHIIWRLDYLKTKHLRRIKK